MCIFFKSRCITWIWMNIFLHQMSHVKFVTCIPKVIWIIKRANFCTWFFCLFVSVILVAAIDALLSVFTSFWCFSFRLSFGVSVQISVFIFIFFIIIVFFIVIFFFTIIITTTIINLSTIFSLLFRCFCLLIVVVFVCIILQTCYAKQQL